MILSLSLFSLMFSMNTNPSYHSSYQKKIQCSICNQNLCIDDSEYKEHILQKDIINANKAADKENAVANRDNTLYVTFDLEAILTLPKSENSLLHYARKLSVFNKLLKNFLKKETQIQFLMVPSTSFHLVH